MEFRAHLPGLDNVGGTISLQCLGWGPTPYALRETPGLTSVVWDSGDRVATGTPEEQLAEHQRQQGVVQAAAAQFVDQAGNLAFVYDGSTREEGGETVSNAPDHLRIYGHPRTPSHLVAQYLANRPPVGFDFSLLEPTKKADMPPMPANLVPGDIPEKVYFHGETAIAKRVFDNWNYITSADKITGLEYDVTPYWFRNDGQLVAGATVTKTITGSQYNKWRKAARVRIEENLQVWVPASLLALELVATLALAEQMAREWLGTKHPLAWNQYLTTGDRDTIVASLEADAASGNTPWLNSEIPSETIEGVPDGTTVLELITGTLR